jgi:uncharacterized membrane protein YcjF (UPF0283 family)
VTVILPPCPVCGWGDWPEGGMHAARYMHLNAHERRGETVENWIQEVEPVEEKKIDWSGRLLNLTLALVGLAVLAGVVMVLYGIWGDLRWVATGVVTVIVSIVTGALAEEFLE